MLTNAAQSSRRFENQRVLITGAAGGIGRVASAAFAGAGARVVASDMPGSDVVSELSIPGDLSDPAFANDLVARAAQLLGGLDILINNAGVMRRGAATDTTDDDLRQSLAVNVEAPFRLSRAAVPVMAEGGGGAIVNTASCWGVHPGPGHAIYCMTKAAVASMTQVMGRDHAHQNIRVNAVCPNEVDTPMLRTGFSVRGLDPTTAIADLDATVPLGRIAQPEDIVDVILFLASDESRYMCGSLVEVNGGKSVA